METQHTENNLKNSKNMTSFLIVIFLQKYGQVLEEFLNLSMTPNTKSIFIYYCFSEEYQELLTVPPQRIWEIILRFYPLC